MTQDPEGGLPGSAPSAEAVDRALPGASVPPALGTRFGAQYFVERRIYRRRRLVDAACTLPALALLLWWLPLLWSPEMEVSASTALVYIFVTWVGLAVGTGLLIGYIRRYSAPDRPEAPR